jgi:hypothetical protein
MKSILFLAMMVFGMNTFAQLNVQKKDTEEKIWRGTDGKSLQKMKLGEDSAYVFFFKNMKYKSIVQIEYIKLNNRQSLEDFLHLCQDAIDNDAEYTVEDTDTYMIAKIGKQAIILSSKWRFFLSLKEIQQIKEKL